MLNNEISDTQNSALMALDFIGTAIESRSNHPITIGGQANQRYREFLHSHVPIDYEPELERDVRTRKYFKANDLQVSKSNVYVAWAVTFIAWVLIPITQSVNLARYIQSRIKKSSRSK